jgi:hypothetical protein
MKSLLTAAATALLIASVAAPALAKGAPTPVVQPLRPGECTWGKSPVRNMDGSWTNPNRCYGEPSKVWPGKPYLQYHQWHRSWRGW